MLVSVRECVFVCVGEQVVRDCFNSSAFYSLCPNVSSCDVILFSSVCVCFVCCRDWSRVLLMRVVVHGCHVVHVGSKSSSCLVLFITTPYACLFNSSAFNLSTSSSVSCRSVQQHCHFSPWRHCRRSTSLTREMTSRRRLVADADNEGVNGSVLVCVIEGKRAGNWQWSEAVVWTSTDVGDFIFTLLTLIMLMMAVVSLHIRSVLPFFGRRVIGSICGSVFVLFCANVSVLLYRSGFPVFVSIFPLCDGLVVST